MESRVVGDPECSTEQSNIDDDDWLEKSASEGETKEKNLPIPVVE